MTMDEIRIRVKELNITNKRLAEITYVSEPTVSRYLSGASKPTVEFIELASEYLGSASDEPTDSKGKFDLYAKTIESYESRLRDKAEQIAELKARVLELLRDGSVKNIVIGVLAGVLIASLGFNIWLMYDGYNGDIGLFRYEEQLRNIIDEYNSEDEKVTEQRMDFDSVIGLWADK